MKKRITCAVAGALLLAAGCFTSIEPVYDDTQVFQDNRIKGAFENTSNTDRSGNAKRDGSVWTVAASTDHEGKYQIIVTDGSAQVELLGTLFHLDKLAFLDLYPVRDSGMNPGGGGGPPSVSEIIHGVMYERRHVIWKVELADTGVTYWFPHGNGIMAALKKAPGLKRKSNDEAAVIVLPEPKKAAQDVLRQLGADTEVFNYKGQLVKRKKE